MKSFLKKEGAKESRREELVKNTPVYDEKLKAVFVNGSKFKRAQTIVDLINGIKVPQKAEEQSRVDHYLKLINAHGIDLKSDEAVPAVYELLGGLIRTPEEQKAAEHKAIEVKKKKKMIE
jgi:hypothetical protein